MDKKTVNSIDKKQTILMKDEVSNNHFEWTYEDHISTIIKRAEEEGQFDNIKGKKLQLDGDLTYNPEKQFNKMMKNNNVLPPWVELGKEIDQLKEELKTYTQPYNIKRTVAEINKKVLNHNISCPRPSQKTMVKEEDYL
jgi:hypothetical protein